MNYEGKILIADDEAHVRQFLGLIVRGLGSPIVFEAGNGQDALEIFERERPGLVLLDVNMPGIDGLETLNRISAIDPEANVVILTSMTNRQTVEGAAEAGAVAFIRKDTPRAEILRELTELLSETAADSTGPTPPPL
ncbi:MAG: response regulator [Puniceicoccaceae bacterium]|nr:MAG: response regulator [Puniceicoccaceae bacterium]